MRADAIASSVERGADDAFDVELPADVTAYFQDVRARPYYAVWSGQGQLIDRSDPDLVAVRSAAAGSAHRRHGARDGDCAPRAHRARWPRHQRRVGRTRGGSPARSPWSRSAASRRRSPARGFWPDVRSRRCNGSTRPLAAWRDGDLDARIAIERTDTELGQVASALNLAFDRLRESIERQRQFTADASHELRTPVTTMMAELEWAMLRDRPAADYQESLETCHRAGARMQSLVEGLLTLARADSGELAGHARKRSTRRARGRGHRARAAARAAARRDAPRIADTA